MERSNRDERLILFSSDRHLCKADDATCRLDEPVPTGVSAVQHRGVAPSVLQY